MAKMPKDPETGGGATDPDTNGGKAGPVTLETVQELIGKVAADMRGELNKAVTGAVHRNVTDTFKSAEFTEGLKGAFFNILDEREKATTPKDPPTDVDALKEQISTLTGVVKSESKARKEAEARAAAQSLDNGILAAINALDGKEGRPNLRKDARDAVYNLVRTGYGLPNKPELGDNGAVIIRMADGEAKPLATVLGNGYFGQDHWAIEKFAASGSGARQSSTSSPAFDWKDYGTVKGDEELARRFANDPDGLVAALQNRGK